MNTYYAKIKLTELANKLFMYNDSRDWQILLDEVFSEKVDFDMSSSGGEERKKIAANL